MSACLNTLSGTIYEDFIKPWMPKNTTEKRASNIMKCIVVILGTFCTGMVFVVENLDSALPLSISFGGVASGPLLGIFTLGMMIPFANTWVIMKYYYLKILFWRRKGRSYEKIILIKL